MSTNFFVLTFFCYSRLHIKKNTRKWSEDVPENVILRIKKTHSHERSSSLKKQILTASGAMVKMTTPSSLERSSSPRFRSQENETRSEITSSGVILSFNQSTRSGQYLYNIAHQWMFYKIHTSLQIVLRYCV